MQSGMIKQKFYPLFLLWNKKENCLKHDKSGILNILTNHNKSGILNILTRLKTNKSSDCFISLRQGECHSK